MPNHMKVAKQHFNKKIETLNISPGQVISIIGSGGKTTLMLELAKVLAENYRVMVSTTTRIFMPVGLPYQVDVMPSREYLDVLKSRPSTMGKVYVYGSSTALSKDPSGSEQHKLSGFSQASFEACSHQLLKAFDIILLEADGSRQKPFKGWLDHEPVIPDETTMTIGVFGVHQLGIPIDEDHIHRLEAFKAYLKSGETVMTKEILLRVMTRPDGIFAKAKGRRVVYLAGASETLRDWFEERLYGEEIEVIN